MQTQFTTNEKASEARGEVTYREYVYPRQVKDGKMTPNAATRGVQIMQEIADEYDGIPNRPRFDSAEKAKVAQREVRQREWLYPKRIHAGKMTAALSAHRIAIMQEIADEYAEKAMLEDKQGRLL